MKTVEELLAVIAELKECESQIAYLETRRKTLKETINKALGRAS